MRPYRIYTNSSRPLLHPRRRHFLGQKCEMALPVAEKKRYLLKLEVPYTSNDPDIAIGQYQLNDDEWKDDVALRPSVKFGKIYAYLIDTPGQSTREMKRIIVWRLSTIMSCRLGFVS